MIKYKRVDAANGRTMYFKNGNLVKKDEIPQAILNNLEDGSELTTDTPNPPGGAPTPGGTVHPEFHQTVDEEADNTSELEHSKGSCIFCGEPATRKRFVNLKTAELCDEDYNSHTTGEIAAQMREVQQKNTT